MTDRSTNPFIYLILLAIIFSCSKKIRSSKPTSNSHPKSTSSDNLGSAKNPLILLDFEVIESRDELDAIDPNSIEKIEVIKDTVAAKKLYGEKGRDGVIIIRTKTYEQKKNQQLYDKLQQHLKNALGNEDEYFIVLDGLPISSENIEKLFTLKPEEILAVEEISEQAAASIFCILPKKHTILINTKKGD